MRLRTPFLPGISPLFDGRAPAKLAQQLVSQVNRFKPMSLGGLQEFFSPWLPADTLQDVESASGSRRRCFWQDLTFWAFLCQVLDPDCACREIVRKIQCWCDKQGFPRPSSATGGYCRARQRLPLALLQRAWEHTASVLGALPAQSGVWAKHRLLVADGTGVSMPDTPSNQDAYPQPSTQTPGCGFPVMKWVGVFCLKTGALLRWAEGNLHNHECALFENLLNFFRPGDILVGDRAYGGFPQLAKLAARKVDVLARVHQCLKVDMRRGRCLGRGDRLYVLKRSPSKYRSMTREQWASLPKELTVRLIRVVINVPGFRVKKMTLVTTLLDPKRYPKEAIVKLYRERWKVELHFREIKQTLSLDILRCKTQSMIEKEMCMHAIAYNLVRAVMREVAIEHNIEIGSLSFKGTLDAIRMWREDFRHCVKRKRHMEKLRESLYETIATDLLPYRPDRSEPRAIKRRKKGYRLLTKPRSKMVVEVSRRQK